MIDANDLPAAVPVTPEPVRLPDVPGALLAVNPVGEYLAIHPDDMHELRYTTVPENAQGLHNHFQGIQRLYGGEYLVVSGSNYLPNEGSELYIARMDSRSASGPWLSNLTTGKEPPAGDEVVVSITIDRVLWHAGGMDVLDNILAVPTEHNNRPEVERFVTGAGRPPMSSQSKVYFFDVADPRSPKFFKGPDEHITRPDTVGGAAALTRLPNGHYLCGMWTDSDKDQVNHPPRLDLYLSENPVFDGRFRQGDGAVGVWKPDPSKVAQFQTVNFLHGEDGRLYLAGFFQHKSGHYVRLHTVDIPDANSPPTPGSGVGPPTVTRVAQVKLTCGDDYGDMRGASGAYTAAGEILLYSAAQFRKKPGDIVRFTEFRRPLRGASPVTLGTAWVELYSRTQLKGATLTLRGLDDAAADLENYKKVRVRGRHFGDKARSVRYQLPSGYKYCLYRHDGYRDLLIELKGTDRVEHEPDFDALGFGREVSSSRLERT